MRTKSAAAADILGQLVESGLEWKQVNTEQPVHDAITYIQNHRERMDYATALRCKLPIGSGNVEATCKTLVAVRMKRAGSRWHEETGEHVIRMRALALSDRWDPAMAMLHRSRATSVRRAASWGPSGLARCGEHTQLAGHDRSGSLSDPIAARSRPVCGVMVLQRMMGIADTRDS